MDFEINFGAYQPAVSQLRFTEAKRINKLEKKRIKIEDRESKKMKEVPKEFVKTSVWKDYVFDRMSHPTHVISQTIRAHLN